MSRQADIDSLKLQLEAASGDVDILLTCEWPESITLATPPGSVSEITSQTGDLILQLQQHICAIMWCTGQSLCTALVPPE